MGEALKTFFSPALVRRLAEDLARVEPGFPSRAFIAHASAGLDELELLGRGKHIAAALGAHLPPAYPEAIDVLLRSLGPAHVTDELVGVGMAPFFYLPHTLFVAERGLDHFEVSMRAQYELTKRFSAEFSIRPYLAREPERTFAVLRTWAHDTSAHVRRLVSEGTRLRLPWAMRVAWLDRNPDRILELLELLKDDPSTLVRRSVANSLNDLGKVHPRLLIETCTAWIGAPSAERRALVEHALRSAIKRGEPGALRLLGYGKRPSVAIEDVGFQPRKVAIGGQVVVTFVLRGTARTSQDLLVDLAVHFVKANGRGSPKVFKLERVVLPARGRVELRTKVSLAVHTTRKPRPGRHAVDVLVNGQATRLGAFEVIPNRSRAMAYDEKLADRIRQAIGPRGDVTEKKMFGGVAFLLHGKMFCGIANENLMVRVGPDGYEAALAEAHTRPMDFTGRPMKGYVYVAPGGARTVSAIKKWVDRSVTFVATLEGVAARRKPTKLPPRKR